MKKILTIALLAAVGIAPMSAQYYSVNIDYKTAAAMVGAYGTETAAEAYYSQQVEDILKKYTNAEMAAAGIFSSKYLDRKALTDMGIWVSPDENYYYRRIYKQVSSNIMPKIWTVSGQMIHSPQNALYWGSYLAKVCAETKSLCQQFESVVTNGRLSFSDVAFLEMNPEFAALFDVVKNGGQDWRTVLDGFGNISGSFTKENLKNDINTLYQTGTSIAQTGVTNLGNSLMGGSSFNGSFMDKASAVYNIASNGYNLFNGLRQDMPGTVMDLLGGEANVSKLWKLSNYNMTGWTTDYAREAMGQYYTQRWYIYWKDAGSEVLCDYEPPTDDNSILKGDHWYRIETKDPNFYPNSAQIEAIKQNSENHAGWSRSRVNQLNSQATDGSTYSISEWQSAYIISQSGKQTKKAYAYSVYVTRSWNRTEEVYEDFFDSYSMDLNTFKKQLQVKCDELNINEDGRKYYIGSDSKQYYQTTDATKMKGCEMVIISVTCNEDVALGEGNTQYKCSSCGSSLNDHTRQCVMKTTLSGGDGFDTSDLDREEQDVRNQISDINTQIANLESENAAIIRQLSTAPIEQQAALRQRYNENKSKIDSLKSQLNSLNTRLSQIQQAKDEARDGEQVQTDDYYRIPSIMNDVKTTYNLTWTDEGHWEGWNFVRTAKMGNMTGEVKFIATVSMVRKPKYFLGIKIHRAIIGVSWKLTAHYSNTQVVDMLELDSEMDDAAKAQLVNNRLSEVARDYPECQVSHEYIKSESVEVDDSEDVYHLLWSSDRLEIAREIDARLTKIYADLISLEKMMNYKLRWIDVWNRAGLRFNLEKDRKLSIIQQAHKDWMDNAYKSAQIDGGGNGNSGNGGTRPPFRPRDGWYWDLNDAILDDRFLRDSLLLSGKEVLR